MRMRAHVDAFAEQEFGRAHLVEEDEGADHLAADRGQGPADREAAEIMRARHDHLFERLAGAGIARDRVMIGQLRHGDVLPVR